MKIQLKRSNLLDGNSAKIPSEAQMEYGELAVNYNTDDPAIFIKDSDNSIIRIAGAGSATAPKAGNGQINITAGTGISASGTNATADQSNNTNRTISVDTVWLDERIIQKTPGVDLDYLNDYYLSLQIDAGDQEVLSTGSTSFNGSVLAPLIGTLSLQANYYNLEALAPLPS